MIKTIFNSQILKAIFLSAFLLVGGFSLCVRAQNNNSRANNNSSANKSPSPESAAETPDSYQTSAANQTPPDNPSQTPANKSKEPDIVSSGDNGYLGTKEFTVTLLITIVSIIALTMVFFLLGRIQSLKSEDILRTFGVVLIIMGTLYLIATGFSADDIAPAMGLFGTVAGYLLGKSEKNSADKPPPPNDKPDDPSKEPPKPLDEKKDEGATV